MNWKRTESFWLFLSSLFTALSGKLVWLEQDQTMVRRSEAVYEEILFLASRFFYIDSNMNSYKYVFPVA